MGILLLPSVILGIIVLMVFQASRRLARVGGSEESAHAMALERRRGTGADRRRERRHAARRAANASILGSEGPSVNCQIVDVSRSGMRITLSEPVPMGAQVHVTWGSEFLVGTVCYTAVEKEKHVVGLQAISTNRR